MAVARERVRDSGGPRVAGVELAAGLARVIVARAESGRLRVLGRGESALGPDAITGGLVVDRPVGTRRIYRLDPDGVAELRAQLERFWTQALANYKQLIEQSTEEDQ